MNANKTIFLKENTLNTAYQFSFNYLIEDRKLKLSDFEGKVILVVNTASKCGFTSQYADLEDLYKQYRHKGFIIIGVPSNDFGNQELDSNKAISAFCNLNYGITFFMAAKEKVVGKDAHPFYIWAKETLGFGTAPKWNFHKYLINRQGKLVDYFHSNISPKNIRLKKAIENALIENIAK